MHLAVFPATACQGLFSIPSKKWVTSTINSRLWDQLTELILIIRIVRAHRSADDDKEQDPGHRQHRHGVLHYRSVIRGNNI